LVTLIVVIAVAATVITAVLLTRNGSPQSTTTASTPTDGVASANDDGPLQIITDEPTCDAWTPIVTNARSAMTEDWLQRDPTVPVAGWSPQLRTQYQSVGQALRTAADATVLLAKQTPHRAVRELYAQFIAYNRAYADALADYAAADNELLIAANSAASAVTAICSSITDRSAQARAAMVTPVPAPNPLPTVGDVSRPTRALTSANPVCQDWSDMVSQYLDDVAPMLAIDNSLNASQWTPQQKAAQDAAVASITQLSGRLRDLGARSANSVIADLANVAAVYMSAYAAAIPTHVSADADIYNVATGAIGVVWHGCQALGA
jgi:hypothetical protein